MTITTIYEDDGGVIVASSGGLTICSTHGGEAITLPLSRLDLAQVGDALIEFSSRLYQEEIAGAELGRNLVQTLLTLRGKPQAQSLRAVHDALNRLVELDSEAAAGGLAAAVVNVFEVGVASLQKSGESK